jgi:Tat protein secretion system quality control protein TatD with DNase activity
MIAKVRGQSIEEVARQTTHNAEKLFGWQEV